MVNWLHSRIQQEKKDWSFKWHTWTKKQKSLARKLLKFDRVAKVVKGGRRFSFNALTVVGDSKNRIGIGFGKANEVPDAIRKSIESAKRTFLKSILSVTLFLTK